MKSVFVDPSVLLLAVGTEHPLKDDCRAVLKAASRSEIRLHMSVEGGQEFLLHRLRRAERADAMRQFDIVNGIVVWHAFDAEVLGRARDLMAAGVARGREAVHAATALIAGFDSLVSCDRDFDGIPGLRRVEPRELA